MSDRIVVGDYVQIQLPNHPNGADIWYPATVTRIEPYSEHRSFYWVRLEEQSSIITGISEISIFNPKFIRKTRPKN